MPSNDPLLFDQFSRYESLARVLRAIAPDGGRVLDVGSGPARLLGRFLPEFEVLYLDPLIEADGDERSVPAGFDSDAGRALESDYAVSVDALEHIPVAERESFLESLVEHGPRGVLISCPWSEGGEAEALDRWVDDVYRAKTGGSYSWLAEHFENGLPSREETARWFEARGWSTRTLLGNGHVPWLKEMLGLTVCLLDEAEELDLVQGWSELFRDSLAAFDHFEPCYRKILYAALEPRAVELSIAPDDERQRARAAAAFDRMRQRMIADVCARVARLHERCTESKGEHERAVEWGGDLQGRLAEGERRSMRLEVELETLRASKEESARQLEGLERHVETLTTELESLCARHEARGDELKGLLARLLADSEARERTLARRLARAARHPLRSSRSALRIGWARSVELGPKALYHLLPLSEEHRWRAKSWFFSRFGGWIPKSESLVSFEREREWRERSAQSPPPELRQPPVAARPGVDDVLVFAVIDWHFRFQRPQHLARGLAEEGRRVFYISTAFQLSDEPGFHVERLDPTLPLYSIRLHANPAPVIYDGPPEGRAGEQLAASLRALLAWARPLRSLLVVEHPGWFDLARLVPAGLLVYDCMDYHHGFSVVGDDLGSVEERLVRDADLVTVSSEFLREWVGKTNERVGIVRNACEYEHFASEPAELFVPEPPAAIDGPVLGYYGAIAEWFDVELVEELARRLSDWTLLLVGADSAGALAWLEQYPNVLAIGEVPYEDLPRYLYAMDVCMIPFRVTELTLATNPVKVYEYLAAGKPVVTVDLPELRVGELKQLVSRASTAADFAAATRAAWETARDEEAIRARRAFAARQTWADRTREFGQALQGVELPLFSVIVLSWNGLELTRRCVEAVLADDSYPNLELILVDNASEDGTPAWLDEIEGSDPRLRIVRNERNLGFAAGNNRGLEVSSGEFVALLNNDTVPAPGWLRTLRRRLADDPSIGLLGPVTNNIGNEARVPTEYSDMSGMRAEAATRMGHHAGETLELSCLAFFCVALRRSLYEELGGLDEGYGLGFFEDDDYCRRVRATGRRLVVADDVFVHHELSASFEKLGKARRDEQFELAKTYFESKWGAWTPHEYRAR